LEVAVGLVAEGLADVGALAAEVFFFARAGDVARGLAAVVAGVSLGLAAAALAVVAGSVRLAVALRRDACLARGLAAVADLTAAG
jgi:cell division protein FtsX